MTSTTEDAAADSSESEPQPRISSDADIAEPAFAVDLATPDVRPGELLAWVGVHALHYLSSERSFALYVRGWNVVEKILHAKQTGSFASVLAQWRLIAADLPSRWRSGPIFGATGPPANQRRR